jgi:hypothetical protein
MAIRPKKIISSRGESGVGAGSGRGSGGSPKFTDYGLRRATNDLTKAEKAAEHKWRMKNDLDYKNEIAIKKAKTKPTPKPSNKNK